MISFILAQQRPPRVDMEHKQLAVEHAASGATGGLMKTAPPVAVAGMSFAGVQLQDWVYIATLAWIAFQLCAAIYDRFFKDAKK